jgi:hypothetical protein
MMFELWVESRDERDIDPLISHFDGQQSTLITGRTVRWQAGRDFENKLAMSVEAVGLNRYGIATRKDAIEQKETELRFYHHLLTAPRFSYAHAYRQAYMSDIAELSGYLEYDQNGAAVLGIECVLADEVWESIGKPSNARPFKPGYWWVPWQPPTVGDEAVNRRAILALDKEALLRLYAELFPD